ncbi:MAG: FG-GAP repeat domain-containing protein, partial [Bradymonadia bacterium]
MRPLSLLFILLVVALACDETEPGRSEARLGDSQSPRGAVNTDSIPPDDIAPLDMGRGLAVDAGPLDARNITDVGIAMDISRDESGPPPRLIPGDESQQTFVNLSALIADNPSKRRYGIAVTDLDLDGDFEAVVTGYGGANEVIDWRGDGFVDVAPAGIKDAERRAIGVAACDLDGDGREELYFLNVDRFGGLGEVSDRLYQRDGRGGWFDVFEQASNREQVNQFSGRSVACLDRMGTGRYGVFVANYGGPMKLFELSAEGVLRDNASAANMALTTGGRSLVVLPGPMGLDVFAGNENGPNFFFEALGDGRYVERAAEYGIDDRRETVRGVTLLDANGDGLLDLLYGNWEGPHRLFLRNQDRTFTDVMSESAARPSRIRSVIAADFDNDGFEEVFFNNIGEPNRLFRSTDGRLVEIDIGAALEPDGLGTGAAVLDMDEDGRLELLVAHGESGSQPLSIFRWGKNNNNFLRISPQTRTGGPARGARVILEMNDGR